MKLAPVRLWLMRARPYLSAAIAALVPVEKPGLGSMAVDERWRLYYDPAFVDKVGVELAAGVLAHEVAHLLRDHARRLARWANVVVEVGGRQVSVANLAGDLAINDDLDLKIPPSALLPGTFGFPAGLLEEEYAELLLQQQKGDGAGQSASSAHQLPSSQEAGEGVPGGDATSGIAAVGVVSPHGACDRANASAQGGATPTDGDVGTGTHSLGSAPPHPPATPDPLNGYDGSGATGIPAPWELPPDSDVPRISPEEATAIRIAVAKAIRSRGDAPAGWRRWADGILSPPATPWQAALRAVVRNTVARVAGAYDYSYARPARRQMPGVILPGRVAPQPEVAVVVDTSGSISDEMLSEALGHVSAILKTLNASVRVLACDAAVHAVKRVASVHQAREILIGGGGTDMRVGIAAALDLRPKPDAVVVLTDGETPWPTEAPERPVVVCLLGNGGRFPPSWAKVVRIGGGAK